MSRLSGDHELITNHDCANAFVIYVISLPFIIWLLSWFV